MMSTVNTTERLYISPSGEKAFVPISDIHWLQMQPVAEQDEHLRWLRTGGVEAEA